MTPYPLKAALLLVVLFQLVPQPVASPNHFRFERVMTVPKMSPGPRQACAVLDAEVFAHSSASLKDLRIFHDGVEVPYATTLSDTLQQESEDARVLNLGVRAGRIVFDLEMPHRAYTSVALDLAAKDFIATAEVSGKSSPSARDATTLGTFTLFDLTAQRLSHSTSLSLQESSFAFLHIELAIRSAPGGTTNAAGLRDPEIVRSANVPPSREAQTVYTTVAQTAGWFNADVKAWRCFGFRCGFRSSGFRSWSRRSSKATSVARWN